MSDPDTTSSAILAGSAYADDRHLAARQSLYRWQHPSYDLPGLVLERIPRSAKVALDVGCGNGKYLDRMRTERPALTAIGFDISPGILTDVAPPTAVADAAKLPVADRSADAILAMHMLYHVDDVDAALAEASRALASGGIFIASTNARDDKHELDDLWAQAAALALGVDRGPRRISLSSRFPLDDAPTRLSEHFAEVRLVPLHGTITVHDPEPVIAHLASYRTWAETSGVPFDATLEQARAIVADVISRDGGFAISCLSGILVCRSGR